MIKVAKYQSELLRVQNKTTGKWRYFIKDCAGDFTRISKADYEKRYDDAGGVSNLLTKTSNTHNRHYTTVVYYA